MVRLTGLVLALTLLLIGTALAQEEDVTDFDRFRLWLVCAPVSLIVEQLDEDAGEIGLTKEAIETAVRSRLRAARIYDADASPYLYVNVTVVGSAFRVSFEFHKYVLDYVSNQSYYTTTWDTGVTGTYSSGPDYILGSVSRVSDHFIDEYLRVNTDACS